MNIAKLIFKLVVIVLLVGIIFIASKNSTSIRQQLLGAKSAVAGASTSAEALENQLPTELKEDTEKQIENLQEKVLEVKVHDIFSFFSQAGKIVDDFHAVQKNVTEELDSKEQ